MIPINNDQQFAAWISTNVRVPSIRRQFFSGAFITGGTGVYMSTDGKVYPYTTSNSDTYIGIAERTTAISCIFTVVIQGYLHVLGSGWSAGQVYYIQNGGTISTSVGDKKVAVGVGQDAIVIYTDLGNGGGIVAEDGYAKPLMLMGG
jgi:hypothetical protein